MKNINLLPRIPFVQRQWVPLTATMIAFFCFASLFLLYFNNRMTSETSDKQAGIASMNDQIQQLKIATMPDPKRADYDQYLLAVTALEQDRRDWMPVFGLITSHLPETSRILTMGVTETDQISIMMQTMDLINASEYISILQDSHLVESVSISSAAKIQLKEPAQEDGNKVELKMPDTGNVESNPTMDDQDPIIKEELLDSLQEDLPQDGNESDDLLRRLDSLIKKQMVEQQNGIEIPEEWPDGERDILPDSISGSEAAGAGKDSPFTKEEIEEAHKWVEQFNQQNPAEDRHAEIHISPEPSEEQITELSIYQVTLQIKLKPYSTVK